MSFYNLNYHIVFSTKRRLLGIPAGKIRDVHAIIYTLLKDKGCFVHRIGGIEDHVHILVEIPVTQHIPDLMSYLKSESSKALRYQGVIPDWVGWQEGYGIFTVSRELMEQKKNYIKNQREHHKGVSFIDELREMLIEIGVSPDSPYFPK